MTMQQALKYQVDEGERGVLSLDKIIERAGRYSLLGLFLYAT